MAPFAERYGPWALITGAAMGIGAALARQVAARGVKLLLVDRDGARLGELAQALSAEVGVEVRPVVACLEAADFLAPIERAAEGCEIGLLINNAGVSRLGLFLDVPLEAHLHILDVNARAAMMLAHRFGAPMRGRGRGGIVFLSSISALVGTSHVSEYAATKAHNLVLGEALWEELRPAGVDVLSAVVGATDTPGFRADNPDPDAKRWPPVMSAADTAREILDAIGRAPRVVPGRRNRLAAFFLERVLSRRAAILAVGKEMRKRYRAREP